MTWGAGEVAQWLRAQTALLEDQSSIPSTRIKWLRNIISLTPGESNSSGLHWHPHVHVRVDTHTHTQTLKNNWSGKPHIDTACALTLLCQPQLPWKNSSLRFTFISAVSRKVSWFCSHCVFLFALVKMSSYIESHFLPRNSIVHSWPALSLIWFSFISQKHIQKAYLSRIFITRKQTPYLKE